MLRRAGLFVGMRWAWIVPGMAVACHLTFTGQAVAQTPPQQGVQNAATVGFAPVNPLPPPAKGTSTGQPVPRFASFKSDKVHLRNGPGTDHAIQWIYNRAGLPVEIIAESEAWRRVRDSEGATGWVLATLLSGRRTALVEPWSLKPDIPVPVVPLKAESRDGATDIAQIEAGVIASVRNCDGRWCSVAILDFRGFIEQHRLWGVYKGEAVKP